jgi:hypothetical protein
MKKSIPCILIISALIIIPSAFAGRVEVTTYYPSNYGEYKNLKSTEASNFATTSGNVGIGTTSPTQKLDVNGTIKATDFSGIANSLSRITATATVDSASPSTWAGITPCPPNYTIIFWGTLSETQYWGGRDDSLVFLLRTTGQWHPSGSLHG